VFSAIFQTVLPLKEVWIKRMQFDKDRQQGFSGAHKASKGIMQCWQSAIFLNNS